VKRNPGKKEKEEDRPRNIEEKSKNLSSDGKGQTMKRMNIKKQNLCLKLKFTVKEEKFFVRR
jgi:hypothetical protein